METLDPELKSFYQDLANRFGILSHLFGQLSSSETTQTLIGSLIAEDAPTFNQLIAGVDIPFVGKCAWVRDIIERVITTPTGFVQECWLRDNLTPDERSLYLSIAIRHRLNTPVTVSIEMIAQAGRILIPPGPFLDELKANGLVNCEMRMTYETSTVLSLGKPHQVCI